MNDGCNGNPISTDESITGPNWLSLSIKKIFFYKILKRSLTHKGHVVFFIGFEVDLLKHPEASGF